MTRVTKFDMLKYGLPIAIALLVLFKCSGSSSKPGLEYMPEMIHSRAYETYTSNPIFENGVTSQLPPEGSVARGQAMETVAFDASAATYPESVESLVNPVEATEDAIARGKAVYTINCTPCHGKAGDGQGPAVLASDYKLAAPPVDFTNPLPDLSEGRMFYTITYGKGLMGSYASQVSQEDRWKVIHYIKTLNKNAVAATPDVDATNVDATPVDVTTDVEITTEDDVETANDQG